MKYIEAPSYEYKCAESQLKNEKSIFLAGSISNCIDWQSTAIQKLSDTDLTLFNPRRANFPINDPSAAMEQIRWEHYHLRYADMIMFWFSPETLGPIVLYELGAWSMTKKPLFVGVDPSYQRKQDVEIQTKLIRPDIQVVYTLSEVIDQVKKYYRKSKEDIK